MKTFKIFRANNQFILTAQTPYGARVSVYPSYPLNVVHILRNIGYKAAAGSI